MWLALVDARLVLLAARQCLIRAENGSKEGDTMRFDRPVTILFAALAAALATGACRASDKDVKKASAAITESGFRALVQGISADELEGRGPGTPGEQRTVEYLEKEFLELGLQPAAGGSFRQDVSLVEITAIDPQLSFARGAGSMTLASGDDMVIGTRRVRPESSIKDSEVVFVGYGIVAPEFGWNDYAGIDMHGKTALILVNDPGFVTGDENLFRGKAMTYHGRWTYKFEEAARQGAAAAIIVHDTAPAAYDWQVVRNGWSRPQFYPDRPDGNAGRTALEGWITHDRARQLMEMAGLDLDAMQAAAVQRGFRPVPLGVTASGGVRNVIRRAKSPNVAGVMPGKDRPDEYVIYVAHWDHLGRSPAFSGDNIFNGAVDNATGVAGILTIAQGFPGDDAGPVAVRDVPRRDGRGVRPDRLRALCGAPARAAGEDSRRHQYRCAESRSGAPRTSKSSASARRSSRTCWRPPRSPRAAR